MHPLSYKYTLGISKLCYYLVVWISIVNAEGEWFISLHACKFNAIHSP